MNAAGRPWLKLQLQPVLALESLQYRSARGHLLAGVDLRFQAQGGAALEMEGQPVRGLLRRSDRLALIARVDFRLDFIVRFLGRGKNLSRAPPPPPCAHPGDQGRLRVQEAGTAHDRCRCRPGLLCILDSSGVSCFRLKDSNGPKRRDRVDDLRGGHQGTGVVREIDVEGGVHLLIRVVRGRVFDHRDLVTKLRGKAHRRFDARVGDEPDDDELVDAVLFEL